MGKEEMPASTLVWEVCLSDNVCSVQSCMRSPLTSWFWESHLGNVDKDKRWGGTEHGVHLASEIHFGKKKNGFMHIGSCFSSFIQLDWSSGELRALMQLSAQQFSKSDIHLFLLTGQQTVTSGPKVLSVKLKSSCGMRVSTAHVLQLQRQCRFLLNYKLDHPIFLNTFLKFSYYLLDRVCSFSNFLISVIPC